MYIKIPSDILARNEKKFWEGDLESVPASLIGYISDRKL